MRILIIEDHPKISQLLIQFCTQEGHVVSHAPTLGQAQRMWADRLYDVIVSDLMLPDGDATAFLKHIRTQSTVYMIVITAKIAPTDKLELLSGGVDDYLTKPFSMDEVLLKLRNVERRIQGQVRDFISLDHHHVHIDCRQHLLQMNGNEIRLTHSELRVLTYLIHHHARVVSRDELLEQLFADSDATDRVIDTYIKTLRRYLNDDPRNPRWIQTFYGQGYQFIGVIDA